MASRSTGHRTRPGETPGGENETATPNENVGGQLKAMFDAVAQAPLPDTIAGLVDELEAKRQREAGEH